MAPIEFNFKAPVLHEDGRITIEPNFPETGPVNKFLAIARNSELPALLQETGELTLEEDRRIQYHHLLSNQPVYVGCPGDEIFDCIFLDEQAIQSHEKVHSWMCELRELLLRRSESSTSKHSAFEFYMGNGKEGKTRFYTLGFVINPQATSIGTAAVNNAIIKDHSRVATATRLAGLITTALLKAYVPAYILELLEKQADVDVPLTLGHETNSYTTTLQLNMSSPTETVLKVSLGVGGDLHIDKYDSPRNYTVLLSLSNFPDGYWPGRTMLADLRLYTVLAPMAALIFKGCRSHMSIGPRYAVRSTREQYQPSAKIPHLASQDYIFARLTTINYPRDTILLHSTSKLRQGTPQILRGKEKLETNFPEALPIALAAFGTKENQMKFQAQFFTCNRVRHARQDPDMIVPTADQIAEMFAYRQNGQIIKPNIADIQRVIDANTKSPATEAHRKKFEAFDAKCRNSLSMEAFGSGLREGKVVWVETPGASLKDHDPNQPRERIDPKDQSKVFIHSEFGPKPYECDHCTKRYPAMLVLEQHHKAAHPEFEWGRGVYPSRDPSYTKPGVDASEDAVERVTEDNKPGGEDLEVGGAEKKRKLGMLGI